MTAPNPAVGALVQWRPVSGYIGSYEVSSDGQVRSLDRHVPYNETRTRVQRGRILAQGPWKKGYMAVNLSRDGRTKTVPVHRIVLEAFAGPRPSLLHEGCHCNGNHLDNRAENLRWCLEGAPDGRICQGDPQVGEVVERPVLREARHVFEGGLLMGHYAGTQPGWRGTDPDGGTWVRLASAAPWLEVTADGGVHWRLQEEAEAAGLVPLPAPAEPGQFWVLVGGKSPAAAPAPLDPGNPEHLPEFDEKNSTHLRWLADAIGDAPLPWASDEENFPEREQANDEMAEMVEQFADFWRAEADRLDRERAEAEQDASDRRLAEERAEAEQDASDRRLAEECAEAEQDASDRRLAEECADKTYPGLSRTGALWPATRDGFLAGIRAERARQEAGQ